MIKNINRHKRSYSQPIPKSRKKTSKSYILKNSILKENSVFNVDKQQYKITNSTNFIDQLNELEKEWENNSLIRTKR